MDLLLASYVCTYYSALMTENEKLAFQRLMTTAKLTGGQSDIAAQEEAGKKQYPSEFFSNHPEIVALASEGYAKFLQKTASRIVTEHATLVFLNTCPRCGRLARTPSAKQCRYCSHDWHDPE